MLFNFSLVVDWLNSRRTCWEERKEVAKNGKKETGHHLIVLEQKTRFVNGSSAFRTICSFSTTPISHPHTPLCLSWGLESGTPNCDTQGSGRDREPSYWLRSDVTLQHWLRQGTTQETWGLQSQSFHTGIGSNYDCYVNHTWKYNDLLVGKSGSWQYVFTKQDL